MSLESELEDWLMEFCTNPQQFLYWIEVAESKDILLKDRSRKYFIIEEKIQSLIQKYDRAEGLTSPYKMVRNISERWQI